MPNSKKTEDQELVDYLERTKSSAEFFGKVDIKVNGNVRNGFERGAMKTAQFIKNNDRLFLGLDWGLNYLKYQNPEWLDESETFLTPDERIFAATVATATSVARAKGTMKLTIALTKLASKIPYVGPVFASGIFVGGASVAVFQDETDKLFFDVSLNDKVVETATRGYREFSMPFRKDLASETVFLTDIPLYFVDADKAEVSHFGTALASKDKLEFFIDAEYKNIFTGMHLDNLSISKTNAFQDKLLTEENKNQRQENRMGLHSNNIDDLNTLLSEATNNETIRLLNQKEWDKLKESLNINFTKIREGLNAIIDWRKALAANQKEHLNYLEKQQAYNNLMQGFGVIKQIGELTSNSDIQRFAAIGTYVIQGGAAVMAMLGKLPMAIVGVTNPIGLVLTLSSSLLGIFGAFSKGNKHSSKMFAALFEEVRYLTNIVIKFREEVHQRFDRLEAMELTTQKLILSLYDQLRDNFNFLHHTLTVPTLKNFAEIEQKISAQFDKLNAKINLIELQPLMNVIFETRPYLDGTVAASKLEEKDFITHMSILAGYLIDTVKDPTHTHEVILDNNLVSEHARRTYDALHNINLDASLLPNYIGLIFGYANFISGQQYIDIQADVFNIVVWHKALQTYTDLRRKFPHFAYDVNYKQLDVITTQAKKLQNVMNELRSEKFIQILWDEYKNAKNAVDEIVAAEVEQHNAQFIKQQPAILRNNNQTVHLLTDIDGYLKQLHENKAIPVNPNFNPTITLDWEYYFSAEYFHGCMDVQHEVDNGVRLMIDYFSEISERKVKFLNRGALSKDLNNPILMQANQTAIYQYLNEQSYIIPAHLLLAEQLGLGNFTSTIRWSFSNIRAFSEQGAEDYYPNRSGPVSRCYLKVVDGPDAKVGLSTNFKLAHGYDEVINVSVFEPKLGYLFNSLRMNYSFHKKLKEEIYNIATNIYKYSDRWNSAMNSCLGNYDCRVAVEKVKNERAKKHAENYSAEIRLGYRSGKNYGDEWELFKTHLKEIVLTPKTLADDTKKVRPVIETHFMQARHKLSQALFKRLDKSSEIYRFYAAKQLLISSALILGFPVEIIIELYKNLQPDNEFSYLHDYSSLKANTSTPFKLNYGESSVLEQRMLHTLQEQYWCDTNGICHLPGNELTAVIDHYLALGLINVSDMQLAISYANSTKPQLTDNSSACSTDSIINQEKLEQRVIELQNELKEMKDLLKLVVNKLDARNAADKETFSTQSIKNNAIPFKAKSTTEYYVVEEEEDDTAAERAKEEIYNENNQQQTNAADNLNVGLFSKVISAAHSLLSWIPSISSSSSSALLSHSASQHSNTANQKPLSEHENVAVHLQIVSVLAKKYELPLRDAVNVLTENVYTVNCQPVVVENKAQSSDFVEAQLLDNSQASIVSMGTISDCENTQPEVVLQCNIHLPSQTQDKLHEAIAKDRTDQALISYTNPTFSTIAFNALPTLGSFMIAKAYQWYRGGSDPVVLNQNEIKCLPAKKVNQAKKSYLIELKIFKQKYTALKKNELEAYLSKNALQELNNTVCFLFEDMAKMLSKFKPDNATLDDLMDLKHIKCYIELMLENCNKLPELIGKIDQKNIPVLVSNDYLPEGNWLYPKLLTSAELQQLMQALNREVILFGADMKIRNASILEVESGTRPLIVHTKSNGCFQVQLQKQKGISDQAVLAKLQELNHLVQPAAMIRKLNGLRYQPVPGGGHCLYHAVALYTDNGDQGNLRKLVSDYIETHSEELQEFIVLREGATIKDYLHAARTGKEWADAVEIEVLMRALKRPILIIDCNGKIRNQEDLQRTGEPIFVYYNGHNHYDALLLNEGFTSQSVIDQLKSLTEITAQNIPLQSYGLFASGQNTAPILSAELVNQVSRFSL